MNCALTQKQQQAFVSLLTKALLIKERDNLDFTLDSFLEEIKEGLTKKLNDEDVVTSYMLLAPVIIQNALLNKKLKYARSYVKTDELYELNDLAEDYDAFKQRFFPKETKETLKKKKSKSKRQGKQDADSKVDEVNTNPVSEEKEEDALTISAKPDSVLASTQNVLNENGELRAELVFYNDFLSILNTLSPDPGTLENFTYKNHAGEIATGLKLKLTYLSDAVPVIEKRKDNKVDRDPKLSSQTPVIVLTNEQGTPIYFEINENGELIGDVMSDEYPNSKPVYYTLRSIEKGADGKFKVRSTSPAIQSPLEILQTLKGGAQNLEVFKNAEPEAYARELAEIEEMQQLEFQMLDNIKKLLADKPLFQKRNNVKNLFTSIFKSKKEGKTKRTSVKGNLVFEKLRVDAPDVATVTLKDSDPLLSQLIEENNLSDVKLTGFVRFSELSKILGEYEKQGFVRAQKNVFDVQIEKQSVKTIGEKKYDNVYVIKLILKKGKQYKNVEIGFLQATEFFEENMIFLEYNGVSKGYLPVERTATLLTNEITWAESEINFAPEIGSKKLPVKGIYAGEIFLPTDSTPIPLEVKGFTSEHVNLITELLFNPDLKIKGARKTAALTNQQRFKYLTTFLTMEEYSEDAQSHVSGINYYVESGDILIKGKKVNLSDAAAVEQAKQQVKDILTENIKDSEFPKLRYKFSKNHLKSNTSLQIPSLENGVITVKEVLTHEFLKEHSIIKIVPLEKEGKKIIKYVNGYIRFSPSTEGINEIQEQASEEANEVLNEVVEPVKSETSNEIPDIIIEESKKDSDELPTLDDLFKLKKDSELDSNLVSNQKAKAWVNSSPLFNGKGIRLVEAFNVVNSNAYGSFRDGVITLWQGADYTVAYHEAWHAFSQHFLNKAEKISLYNYVAKTKEGIKAINEYAQEKDLEVSQLSDMEKYFAVEELIAEDFRQYMLSNGSKILKGEPKRNTIFRRIWNFLKELFVGKEGNKMLTEMYENLRVGNLNKYNPNQTNRIFGKNTVLNKLKPVKGNTHEFTSQDISLTIKTMNGYFSEIVNEISNAQGIQFAGALQEVPERYLPFVYNQMRNKLQNRLDNLLQTETLDAEQINEKLYLESVLDNWGNTKEGFIQLHLEKNKFIDNQKLVIDEESFAVTQDDVESTRFDFSGNELSSTQLAGKSTNFVLSMVMNLDKKGNPIRNKKTGAPELVPYNKVLATVKSLVIGKKSPAEMIEALEMEIPTYPWLKDLTSKLKDPKATSPLEYNNITKKLRNDFYHSFNLVERNLHQTNINKEMYDQEGNLLDKVLITIKGGNVSAVDKYALNEFKAAFRTVDGHPFILETEYGNLLDVNGIINKYFKDGKQVELKTGKQKIEFLHDIGIFIADVNPVQKALLEKGESKVNIEYLLSSLKALHDASISMGEPLIIDDIITTLSTAHYAELNSKDGKSVRKKITEAQTGVLKQLADLHVKYSNNYANIALTTPDGETKFLHSLKSTLDVQVEELNNSESFDELMKLPHMQYLRPGKFLFSEANTLLKALYEFDGTSYGKRRKNVSITVEDLSGVQTVIDGLYADFRNSVVTSKSDKFTRMHSDIYNGLLYGKFSTTTHSDKSTVLSIGINNLNTGVDGATYLHINPTEFIVKQDNISEGLEKAYVLLLPYIQAELDRIAKVKEFAKNDYQGALERIPGVTVPDSKGNIKGDKFQFLSGIFSDESLNQLLELEDNSVENITEDFSDTLIEELSDYFETKKKETEQFMEGMLFIDSVLSDKIKSLDKTNFISNSKVPDQHIKQAVLMGYQVNYFFHQLATTSMFYGDVTEYDMGKHDFLKRNAAVAATAMRSFPTYEEILSFANGKSTDASKLTYAQKRGKDNYDVREIINSAVIKDLKLDSKFMTDPANRKVFVEKYKTLIKKSNPNISTKELSNLANNAADKLINAYKSMEVGDAQGWISFDHYRKLRILSGRWTTNQDKLYYKIVNNPQSVTVEETVEAFPPDKYQYYGPLATEFYNATGFHKYSLMPLIPNLIEGTELEQLHNDMVENDITYVTHLTGSKVSTLVGESNTHDDYHSHLQSDNEKFTFTKNPIYLTYLKNQLDINVKNKKKVIFSTQMRKLIVDGRFNLGIATDAEGAIKVARYERALNNYMDFRLAELKSELGMDIADPNSKPDLPKLLNFIQKELTKQDIADHHLDYIKTDAEGNLTFDLSVGLNSIQIEHTLLAMVNNRLVRQKVTGESLVQFSNAMMHKRAASAEEMEKWGTRDLNYYIPDFFKDGRTLAAEVKLSITQGNFKQLFNMTDPRDGKPIGVITRFKNAEGKVIKTEYNEKASLERLNNYIQSEEFRSNPDNLELITLTGVRIPVQGLNSMEYFIVKEFLPASAGPVIVPPAEIVAKSGSDFDIDKLSMLMPNIKTYGNKVEVLKAAQDIAVENLGASKEKVKQKIEKLKEKVKTLGKQYAETEEKSYKEKMTPEQFKEFNEIKDRFKSKRKSLEKQIKELNTEQKRITAQDNLTEREVEFLSNFDNAVEDLENLIEQSRLEEKQELGQYGHATRIERFESTSIFKNYNKAVEDLTNARFELAGLSSKALENEMLFSITDLISMSDNYLSLVTPNSTDMFTGEGSIVEELKKKRKYQPQKTIYDVAKKENKNSYSELKGKTPGTNILEPVYNVATHEQNAVGKDVLGIGAVANTFNTLFNRAGVVLNPEYKVGPKFYARVKLLLNHNTVPRDGKSLISLSNIYNKEGIKISDVINQLINGWVDVAKDSWIFDIQGNKQLGPSLLFLVQAGVPVKEAIYFLSNPLIQEYVNHSKKLNSPFNLKSSTEYADPVQDILNHFNVRAESFLSEASKRAVGNFTEEFLIKQVNQTGSPYTQENLPVFLHFLEIEKYANNLSEVVNTLNFDTSKQSELYDVWKKNSAVVSMLETEGSMFSTEDIRRVANESPIAPFAKVFDTQTQLWGDLFTFSADPALNDIISDHIGDPSTRKALRNIFGDLEKVPSSYKKDFLTKAFISELKKDNPLVQNVYKGMPVEKTEESLKAGVEVTVDDNQNVTIKLNEKQLEEIYNNNLYAFAKKVEGKYPENSYLAVGLAPVNEIAFDEYNGSNFNEFVKFSVERELLRKDLPKNEYVLTQDFKSKYEQNKSTFPKGEMELIERYEERISNMTYENYLKDQALYKVHNFYQLFINKAGSYGRQIYEIKSKYPELAEKYEIINDLIPSTNVPKKAAKQTQQMLNIILKDNRVDAEMFETYAANLSEITDPSVELLSDSFENAKVKELFAMLPVISVLQSGFDTTNLYSLIKAVPQEQIVQMVSDGLKNLKSNLDESFYGFIDEFLQQNSRDRRNTRRRAKMYVPFGETVSPTITTQPSTSVKPKGTINVYWAQAESATSTKILSNLAPRKFTYQGKEYGSVEHAYQSNKSGKFDQVTYDAYNNLKEIPGKQGPGFGTKIRGKAVNKGFDNLQLMRQLVVESFKQNSNSEAAKKLLQYENFTHNTNEIIDKAFLEGLKLAQQTLLSTQLSTQPTGVKVISEDYGVVQAETNPTETKKQEFLNLIKPQIEAQTYKENIGKGANQMFHFGKMWSRVTAKAKPIKINSFAPTAARDKLIDAGVNAKGNSIGVSEYTYAYHELDQNGNPLPSMSQLQPIIDEIQKALGLDMSNYDSVIGNIYQPNEFIYPHKDVTESKSAEGYPVIVYTMGANAGLGIVDNNKGKMTFANQYDDRYLRGNEKLSGYTNEVLTKNGTIYTFGLNGKGRFQLTHSTPINDAKVGSQLPITLPNGKVITNYTITLTFRRAADLEPGMPSEPAKLTIGQPTQPAVQGIKEIEELTQDSEEVDLFNADLQEEIKLTLQEINKRAKEDPAIADKVRNFIVENGTLIKTQEHLRKLKDILC